MKVSISKPVDVDIKTVCVHVKVRDIAENHIIEDLGMIPTIENWLEELPLKPWMSGGAKKRREERLVD